MPHEVTSWLSGAQGMCWKTTSDGKDSPGCILAVFDGIGEVKWKRGIYIGGFGDVCLL